MVRIVHLADTHLGYKQYNLEEREKDIYDVLEEIGDKILEEHADIVIHSGDLFDSPRPTTQAYYAFKKFLKRLDGKVEFFAVLGDHDKPKARGMPPHKLFDDQIQTLGVAGVSENQQISVDGKKVLIAGISHLSRTYRPILVEELKKLENLKTQADCRVLALHEAIDKFFPFEEACEISLTELPKNFRYYAMGHLHSRIKASYGQGELTYPGSTEIMRSDEIGGWKKLGKGFFIVDVENEKVDVAEVNLERIRPQIEVKLSYAHLTDELEEFVKKIGDCEKLPVVHVRVEGKEIDRQGVHQTLSDVLTGKVLTFRQVIVEESEMRLPELRPGSFHINQVLKDYLKDEKVAQLAVEMLKCLRQGDMEGAKSVADGYFQRLKGGE
ncbi:MAG: DNA repair exonuclease [Candidatus Bathyarchaeota archaeon]|jgi:DNA repair exonuclease SbcCD nuclease subunit|nr:DNA repair exonuclease [Candidatus Bathyarchaeota archaeon A05DMB-3]MDH7606901.1 DNA repair exonuclease [Candidatus Bathyarchaeota archaeon]